MTFILSKLLWGLLRPSAVLVLLLFVGLSLSWRGRRRWGLGCITISAALLALVMLTPLYAWVAAPLENRFPHPAEMPERVDGIIVLGGAIDPEMTALHGLPSLNAEAERMTALAILARRYPSARLVFTGGSAALLGSPFTEADAAKRLFDDLGLDGRVLYEDHSRNTYENAVYSKQLVQPKPGEVWVLITSASHMPRSVGIFRQVGWPVLPWPVAYKTGGGNLTPDLGGHLQVVDWAVHEWAGLAAYRLLGRSSALFPAP